MLLDLGGQMLYNLQTYRELILSLKKLLSLSDFSANVDATLIREQLRR